MKPIDKGVFKTPLSLNWSRALLLVAVILSSACSREIQPVPALQATAYLSDPDVIRVWRQDDRRGKPDYITRIESSLRGDIHTVTQFDYLDGDLTQIIEESPNPLRKTHVRFSREGELSYMQRETPEGKGPVSQDEIIRLQRVSEKTLEMTSALKIGKVSFQQGKWYPDKILTCSGEQVELELESSEMRFIQQVAHTGALPVSIAWLESPEGIQLLMVGKEDFCQSEPTFR